MVDPEFDFGTLVKGEEAVHTFALKNTGDEPVTITRVVPVGCTVLGYDETIPPASEGEVQIALDSASLSGRGTSAVHVFVEGREEPAVTLQLHFEIVAKVVARPGNARWLVVQHEEEGAIPQTVFSTDGEEFDILEVKSPMDAIEVTYREAEPDERVEDMGGSQWRVLATLDSAAPVGPITGFIEVRTDHPEQKSLRIPVSGIVRPTLFIEPPQGDFGTIELAEPERAAFQVRNFATDPIRVTDATVDIPGVAADIETLEEGRRYRVAVEFDPALMKEGPFAGTLRVETDSETVPELSVEITGALVKVSGDPEA